jgi:hypothetical protein
MRTGEDVARFLERRAGSMRLLRAVEALALPDAWIGAGFVRNAVWDHLHDLPSVTGDMDVDVVYFDRADADRSRDDRLEATLRAALPGVPWSVKNQARMHLRNGDRPYRDTADAIAHWPERCTAVAARSVRGRVEVLAPHGIDDLVDLVVRPTAAFADRPSVVLERIRAKRWVERWPRLRIPAEETPGRSG